MATSGASSDGGTEDGVLCPVCLDPFNDPRFLPCHHTYCAKCIQGVADKYKGRNFPCPSCRKPTRLPTGGVQSLQVNYYVTARPMKRARTSFPDGLMCETHEDETLRFYCVMCRKAICRDCKLTKHEGHETDDLSAAEKKIKKKMTMAEDFFGDQVQQLNRQLNNLRLSKKDAMVKKKFLVKSIQDRHVTLVAAADKARDEALQSLDEVMKEVEGEFDTETEKLVTTLNGPAFQNAQDFHQKFDSVNHTSIVEVLELASSMGMNVELSESKFKQELQLRFPASKDDSKICSVVHSFPDNKACSVDSVIQRSYDFVGFVVKTKLTRLADESQVKVMERFKCGQEPNTRVFSLCHCDQELPKLWVSFDQCGLNTKAPAKLFLETGELELTDKDATGRVSYERSAKGQFVYLPPKQGWIKTFTKSLTAGHYRLENNSSGKATLISEGKQVFQIKVGPHHAVDVDDTEKLFVVLEEPRPPYRYRRDVRLYRRGTETPVSTYTSPIQPFQPSDVCFYTLGRQRVLLIADEANDAIHVVRVEESGFTFMRYFAPGCPYLFQPTALNIDVRGRLWVACRGGKIITMEPKD